jgi:hypothetical protein
MGWECWGEWAWNVRQQQCGGVVAQISSSPGPLPPDPDHLDGLAVLE